MRHSRYKLKQAMEKYSFIELRLRELRSAEEAGVFQATRIDAEQLVRVHTEPDEMLPWRRVLRSRRFLVPVSAAALLVMGVWGTMFYVQLGWIRETRDRSNALVSTVTGSSKSPFQRCIAGPFESANGGCRPHDYDADGDVDLADFGNLQLAYAAPGRN